MTGDRTVASGATIDEGGAISISPSGVQETGCDTTEANLKLHTRQTLVDIDIYPNKTFSSLTASPDRCPATSRHRCGGESLIQLLAHWTPPAARRGPEADCPTRSDRR